MEFTGRAAVSVLSTTETVISNKVTRLILDVVGYRPLFHGVELSVTKSMTSCSISNTVMLLPFITVRLGTVLRRGSAGVPPLNMMYGSLNSDTFA